MKTTLQTLRVFRATLKKRVSEMTEVMAVRNEYRMNQWASTAMTEMMDAKRFNFPLLPYPPAQVPRTLRRTGAAEVIDRDRVSTHDVDQLVKVPVADAVQLDPHHVSIRYRYPTEMHECLL